MQAVLEYRHLGICKQFTNQPHEDGSDCTQIRGRGTKNEAMMRIPLQSVSPVLEFSPFAIPPSIEKAQTFLKSILRTTLTTHDRAM